MRRGLGQVVTYNPDTIMSWSPGPVVQWGQNPPGLSPEDTSAALAWVAQQDAAAKAAAAPTGGGSLATLVENLQGTVTPTPTTFPWAVFVPVVAVVGLFALVAVSGGSPRRYGR